jgi:hypothetical protein
LSASPLIPHKLVSGSYSGIQIVVQV